MKLKQDIEAIVDGVGSVSSFRVEERSAIVKVALPQSAAGIARSLKRAIDERIEEEGLKAMVVMTVAKPEPKAEIEHKAEGAKDVRRVIIVASGKGGVGKSSVAAALARMLAARGEKVGVLDADIYGPSQPRLFGLEGQVPLASEDGMMSPVVSEEGIKVCSIGFLIDPADALVWRGPMATSALRQLIHQTDWGQIDTLVVDMPPGTGDVHLTICDQLSVAGAIIVTTPSDLALADVVRGIKMLRNDHIAVEVLGIVNNMAWFEPSDCAGRRYYIFGDGAHVSQLAEAEELPILAEIPITQRVGEMIDPQLLKGVL